MSNPKKIDWLDPKSKISKYFTVGEATFLPSWNVNHSPSETEKSRIVEVAEKLDWIREDLGRPIHVHCWIRPAQVNCPTSHYNGRNYNAFVSGKPGSAHIEGGAVDFHMSAWTCDDLREYLLPRLAELGIRMENKPESNWVHIDIRNPLQRQNRFFRP